MKQLHDLYNKILSERYIDSRGINIEIGDHFIFFPRDGGVCTAGKFVGLTKSGNIRYKYWGGVDKDGYALFTKHNYWTPCSTVYRVECLAKEREE
jgi:hypothetical protein